MSSTVPDTAERGMGQRIGARGANDEGQVQAHNKQMSMYHSMSRPLVLDTCTSCVSVWAFAHSCMVHCAHATCPMRTHIPQEACRATAHATTCPCHVSTAHARTSISVLGFMRVPAMRLQAARMGQAGSGWSGSPEMYDVAYG